MKNVVFIFIGMVLFYSCNKGKYPSPTSVTIHYVDSMGNDLFTNGTNGYVKDSVRIYDWENRIKTLIPYSYVFDPPQGYGLGFLNILPYNTHVVNQYVNSIIHLKAGIEDTLKFHVVANSNNSYDAIWYNGVQKVDSFYITIRK